MTTYHENMSTWQMRRPWWSDRVCLHYSAPVVITSLQILTGEFTAPDTPASGAALLPARVAESL
jgi:hypothetical protein